MSLLLQEWLQSLGSLQPHEFSEEHIDVFSSEYKPRSAWIFGAVQCLEEAAASINLFVPQGVLCAAFALMGGDNYVGVNYHTRDELAQEFGMTPPSLYYFGENTLLLNNPDHPFRRVDLSDFPADSRQWVLLHLEYLHENESEYRRSLWVVPCFLAET
jgi:hypothetical protein